MKTFHRSLLILISVITATGCMSDCSFDTAGHRTEALDGSLWDESFWISAADAPVLEGQGHIRAADGASWFVSVLTNEKEVASAKWMTTGLGVYELYINGNKVGEEFLKPGFTHYEKTRNSYTYDITEAFRTGADEENTLSAQVTPGWWADKIITPERHDGMIGKKCAFRGVLELTFKDGTKKVHGTDTVMWKAGIAGPVKHAAIFDGEQYDAREPYGHEQADLLKVPEINTEFNGETVPAEGAEIYLRHDLKLAPAEAYTWKGTTGATEGYYGKVIISRRFKPGKPIKVRPGETLVVDFGQNCAGIPSFVFKARKGTVLKCLPSELLNDGNGSIARGMDGPEGSCHRENLRIPDLGMSIEYTFGSDGYECYHPRCSFFGYRYISITATDEVTIRSVESIPVTSITGQLETGRLTTGNELINKLISNTYWGQLSNYLSVPTDCPQRDERLGWCADTQVFAETGTFFADTRTFFHKWMRDMRDSQSPTGAFPSVAPYSQYGNEMMRLGWADAGIIVPWTIWKQFNDIRIVEDNWEAMDRFMRHINETRYDHQTLRGENYNFQYADWLSYEPLESCSGRGFTPNDGPYPETVIYWNFLSASYWAMNAGMMADMAKASGHDPNEYVKMAEEARKFIRSEFFHDNGRFKLDILNTMQTPALFALKNRILDGKAEADLAARLRENFKDHGNCLQTGFLGTSILMSVLTEYGMSDIAYELLFQRKNPSWLYSIDNGATTIWERWNSYMIDEGMGPKGMNSFNHYAYGCVCEWLWETAAGIAADTDEPGFRHIIMKPVPDRRLGHLNAEYRSAAGLIRSSWRYEGDTWIWEFTIPEGAYASVTLPGRTESEEYRCGSYTITEKL